MSDEHSPPTATRSTALSPAMWSVLIAVGVLVVIGVCLAVWFLAAPASNTEPAGTATPRPTATTSGPLPDATPTEGSEVLPPSSADPGRLPTLTPRAPLIEPPLPASASGDEALVAGFPSEIMGPSPGADVVQNAIAVEGSTMQASLVGRTDASQEEVTAHYDKLWASLGLTPQASGSAGSLSYAGAFESLSLAFTPASGTGTIFMIYGVFRTN